MTDGGRVVREVVLPAGRDDVWDAITNPSRLAEWFGGEVEIEPVPRGRVALRAEDGSRRSGFVLSADRPFRLAFWWAAPDVDRAGEGTRVEFVLLEHPDGTSLTVTESPAPSPSAGAMGAAPALASA